MAGARWVQREVLEPNPDQSIRVYAVWFNQLPGDSRGAWDPSLLDDARVIEYWDEQRLSGPWFFEQREQIGFEFFGGAVVWDSSLLFGPQATWEEVPSPLEHFGYTVIARSDRLHTELQRLWDTSS